MLEVTINTISHTVTLLESGNILVEYDSPQLTPTHGHATGGRVSYEVHPCQRNQYAFWKEHLADTESTKPGPGRDGAEPWWSLRNARTDTATESTQQMLTKSRKRKTS